MKQKNKISHSPLSFIAAFLVFTILFLLASSVFICLSSLTELPFLSKKHSVLQTELLKKETVVIIDAGHGGEDGGTIGINGTLEKDVNLAIAKKLYTYLSSMGIKCVLTRSEDKLLYDRSGEQSYQGRKKSLDMQERKRIAESFDDVVFISIHQNSFPNEKYSGFQMYYSPNSPTSEKLAALFEDTVRSSLQKENSRHAKSSSGQIYLLDRLKCTAVLLECGFMSNSAECKLLCTEEYQNKLSALFASVIAEYLALEKSSPENP